jgi:hypothetical protein
MPPPPRAQNTPCVCSLNVATAQRPGAAQNHPMHAPRTRRSFELDGRSGRVGEVGLCAHTAAGPALAASRRARTAPCCPAVGGQASWTRAVCSTEEAWRSLPVAKRAPPRVAQQFAVKPAGHGRYAAPKKPAAGRAAGALQGRRPDKPGRVATAGTVHPPPLLCGRGHSVKTLFMSTLPAFPLGLEPPGQETDYGSVASQLTTCGQAPRQPQAAGCLFLAACASAHVPCSHPA